MLRLSRWSNVRQSLSLAWKSCVVIDCSMEKGSRRACSSSALSGSGNDAAEVGDAARWKELEEIR